MISRYGMSREFDMVAMETVNNQYLGGDTSLACSWQTQSRVDELVVELVKRQHEKAAGILMENREKLDELARYLYEKETITGEEFMKILQEEVVAAGGDPSAGGRIKEQEKQQVFGRSTLIRERDFSGSLFFSD